MPVEPQGVDTQRAAVERCCDRSFPCTVYPLLQTEPAPGIHDPTQTDPSGAATRAVTPPSAALDLSPGTSYEVDEPGFHRTSAVLVPIQRFPELSPVNVPA